MITDEYPKRIVGAATRARIMSGSCDLDGPFTLDEVEEAVAKKWLEAACFWATCFEGLEVAE